MKEVIEWISPNDRVPLLDRNILICVKRSGGHYITIGCYDKPLWLDYAATDRDGSYQMIVNRDVVWWAEMPTGGEPHVD